MNKIQQLCKNYKRYADLPWSKQLSGSERMWFAVYDKKQERLLRRNIAEFELATKETEHDWKLVDFTCIFAEWMSQQKYRDMYFESPKDLEIALDKFREFCAERINTVIKECEKPEKTVVALLGVATLFGFVKLSGVLEKAANNIKGRLLVFFPGQYEGSNYRLLDARDGWNYMATPITANSEVR